MPAFRLPAGTSTRMNKEVLAPLDMNAATRLAPGQFVGTVEVGTITTKMNIELTPKNFLATRQAYLSFRYPLGIGDDFFSMGDLMLHPVKDINKEQDVVIAVEVTAGKQYLIRIPLTVVGPDSRTFTIYSGGGMSLKVMFSVSFSGSQEISFTVNPENTGSMYFTLKETSAYKTGFWYFRKVSISEL